MIRAERLDGSDTVVQRRGAGQIASVQGLELFYPGTIRLTSFRRHCPCAGVA